MNTTAPEREVKRDRDGLTKCRVCGCTETSPCNPACGWQRGERDLCTSCAAIISDILWWFDGAFRPNLTGLLRELQAQRAKQGSSGPQFARVKKAGAR